MINSIISYHKIIDKIGEGGMGEVYLAEDTKLKRKVALKILPPRYAQSSDRERFILEAQTAGSLNHPNVCVIHEVLDDHDPPCIVMVFVAGRTLSEVFTGIESSQIDINVIIGYATQIAEALSSAHKNHFYILNS